ncbi:MAG: hypothetical protein JXJ04_20345 [Spirochaetales bacterium]|nr:hypothetical protein [Spirochaetales bacterium]
MFAKYGVLFVYIIVMLLAGTFGGIINYYLESENQPKKNKRSFLLRKSIFLGVGASFIVPLFLYLISSNLIKMSDLDPKEILIFLGFCLIASISSRKFIETISSRILKEVKEAKLSAAEMKSNIEKQKITDQRALELINIIVEENPDSDLASLDMGKLKSLITSASIGARIEIFSKARTFRRNYYETKPEVLDRIIPVFESLIEADKENLYHRNHAQLAYILKDKPQKDYKKAEEELKKAIAIRDKTGKTGFLIYEFNLAVCCIANDPDFQIQKPSSKEQKDKILQNLKKAGTNDFIKDIIKNIESDPKGKIMADWLKYNKVDKNSIISGI